MKDSTKGSELTKVRGKEGEEGADVHLFICTSMSRSWPPGERAREEGAGQGWRTWVCDVGARQVNSSSWVEQGES
jgi:hypothetical protein